MVIMVIMVSMVVVIIVVVITVVVIAVVVVIIVVIIAVVVVIIVIVMVVVLRHSEVVSCVVTVYLICEVHRLGQDVDVCCSRCGERLAQLVNEHSFVIEGGLTCWHGVG